MIVDVYALGDLLFILINQSPVEMDRRVFFCLYRADNQGIRKNNARMKVIVDKNNNSIVSIKDYNSFLFLIFLLFYLLLDLMGLNDIL